MTMPEIVFDAGSPGQCDAPVARSPRVFVGGCVLLATVIVMAIQLLSAPTRQEGIQSPAAVSIVVEGAAVDGWESLVPAAGRLRAGYPPPMVRTTDRVCIGFGRLDFGPVGIRPSLARCERHRANDMAANEIRVLVSVKAGLDTWHFIEAASDIDSIKVHLATGEGVRPDRVFSSGSTGALRLENDRDLASIEWSTRSSTYRCVPDPVAWRTSVFCPDRRSTDDGTSAHSKSTS